MSARFFTVSSLAVLAAMTAACQTTSVVRTTLLESTVTAPPKGRPYLVYPLATTMIVVTVKPARGGDGDKDKEDAKPTAVATNTNNITVYGGAAPSPAGGGGGGGADKPDPDLTVCGDILDAYRAVYAQRIDLARGLRARKQKLSELWVPGRRGDPEVQAKVVKLLDQHVEDAKTDAQVADEANRLAAAFEARDCKTPLVVNISVKTVPDPTRTVALYLQDDAFSADKVSIKLDANGFPTTVTSIADDKSGEAVTAGLKSIANLVGFAAPGPGVKGGVLSLPALAVPPKAPPSSKFTERRMSEAEFVAKYEQAVKDVQRANLEYLSPLEAPLPDGPIVKLISDLSPGATITVKLDPTDNPSGPELQALAGVGVASGQPGTAAAPGKAEAPPPPQAPAGASQIELALQCGPLSAWPVQRPGAENKSGWFSPKINAAYRSPDSGSRGIIVSAQRSCELIVRKGGVELGRSYFLAADSRGAQVIPVSRTSLIARSDTYEMVDGRVTSLSYDKPSPALAVAAWPLKTTGEIISGFSQAVQGRKSLADDQTALIKAQADQADAQASVLNARAALLKAQADLLAAQKAAGSAPASPAPAQP